MPTDAPIDWEERARGAEARERMLRDLLKVKEERLEAAGEANERVALQRDALHSVVAALPLCSADGAHEPGYLELASRATRIDPATGSLLCDAHGADNAPDLPYAKALRDLRARVRALPRLGGLGRR